MVAEQAQRYQGLVVHHPPPLPMVHCHFSEPVAADQIPLPVLLDAGAADSRSLPTEGGV